MTRIEKKIRIYTDGSCRNHGNVKGGHVKTTDPAAWAFLIQYPNGVQLHRSGYRAGETNNAMELQGVISALATITNDGFVNVKSPAIEVIMDSKYIYNAFTKGWIQNWRKKKFHKVKNANKWEFLLYLIAHIADVRFKWVKGHADNKGNNFVNALLNKKMDQIIVSLKNQKKNKEKVDE